MLAKIDLFKRKKHEEESSNLTSKILTMIVPFIAVAYLVIFMIDFVRNPVVVTTETVVASDGNDAGSDILFKCGDPLGCWLYVVRSSYSLATLSQHRRCKRLCAETNRAPKRGWRNHMRHWV